MEKAYFAVDNDALQNLCGEMTKCVERIRENLEGAGRSVTALDSWWSGPSSQVFRQNFSADAAHALELCRCLESCLARMEEADRAYRACEEDVYDTIAKIVV